jgi:hypothetical protein
VGAAVIGGFLAWELHSSHPMLDVRFFENPRFTAASGAITLTFFTLFGSLFLMTQYLQSVLGYSALKAGALLIPQAALMMVVAPASSGFVQRFGNKIVVAFGLSMVALAMGAFALLPVSAHLWQVIGTTMLLGLGMGNVMAPATDSIMGSLPRAKAGVGSAVNDTTRQMGGAVGVAVLGSILASSYRSSVLHAASLQNFPAPVTAAIKDNVGQAVAFAHQSGVGAAVSASALAVARHAYVSAFHTACLLGAFVVAIAVGGVLRWLPAWASDDTRAVSVPVADEVEDWAPALEGV